MTSSISSLVRIWKIRHSSPGCSSVWTLQVVYFPLKRSCLYNNRISQPSYIKCTMVEQYHNLGTLALRPGLINLELPPVLRRGGKFKSPGSGGYITYNQNSKYSEIKNCSLNSILHMYICLQKGIESGYWYRTPLTWTDVWACIVQ